MVKKYLENYNDLGRLPKMIVDNHPRGYVGAVVEGFRGKGKSVFCMITGRQVFQYMEGITRDDAWEKVLSNILFSINEVDSLFDIIDKIPWDDPSKMPEWFADRTHVLKIWDDAGMHGGKYKYQTESKAVDHLLGNIDVMRFVLTGFLINAPEMGNLLKFLREYHDHTVIKIKGRLEGGSDWERRAVFYKWKESRRSDWKLCKNPPHTPFSCWLGKKDRLGIDDQWVYDEFEVKKARAIKNNRDAFRKMAKVAEKSEPDKEPWDAIGLSGDYKDLVF